MAKKSAKKRARALGTVTDDDHLNDTISSNQTSQREKIRSPVTIYHRSDLTEKQQEFLKLAESPDVKAILVKGPAGTAKTFLAILASLEMMNKQKISDIIYVRSAVESSDSGIGFLPGDGPDKLQPYIAPLLDKLHELIPANDIKNLLKDERVLGMHVGFLRGRNWNAKGIIVDEAQNFTVKELITTLTRIGRYTKLFVLGDQFQSDIGRKSGFKKIYNLFDDDASRENGIYTFEFTEEDIVRSDFVKYVFKKLKTIVDENGHSYSESC